MEGLYSHDDLLRASFLLGGSEVENGKMLVDGQDFRDRVNLIINVGKVIQALSTSSDVLFDVEGVGEGGGRIRPTSLGRRLLKIFRKDHFELFGKYPDYKFNPYFEAFRLELESSGLFGLEHCMHVAIKHGSPEAARLADLFNKLVEAIRGRLDSKEFKRKLKNYRRSVIENNKELRRYVDGLFDKHSRMLVIRLDLAYKQEFRRANQLTARDVAAHRRLLFKHLAKSKFGEMLGYAWKFEVGKRKGFHNHVLIFFNGSKSCRDVVIAKMIGDYWKEVITGGDGVYRNCNADKKRYEYCGIGMVRHDDEQARIGLTRIVDYMTKLDEYFKLSVPGVRSFGKGKHAETSEVKKGRPRSQRVKMMTWLSLRPVGTMEAGRVAAWPRGRRSGGANISGHPVCFHKRYHDLIESASGNTVCSATSEKLLPHQPFACLSRLL